MEQDLCEHLHVRHVLDSKKTGREHRPEKPYKKWKRRWVVLSGKTSPSRCYLNYCKNEADWLSKNQSEITKCQLANFSVQKFTGRGEHDNYLLICLRAYAICLSFDSVTKMDQWHKALQRLLECYEVVVQCVDHRELEGEHVIQFSSPGQFQVWGTDGRLQWEWSLQDVRRVAYHESSDQLEIEVGRRSQTGEGRFMFAGPLVFRLFLSVKEAMKASKQQRTQNDAPPPTHPSSHSPTLTDQFYGSISGRSESSISGISLGRLSIVSAPEMVPRRPVTTSSRGLASVSSPPSPETAMRRLTTRTSPSHSRNTLNSSQAYKETTGDYTPLRFVVESPASEYVEICRGPTEPPPRSERSVTPQSADGDYIYPQMFCTATMPLSISEEECSAMSAPADSDDSS